jgi:hypothetical protein
MVSRSGLASRPGGDYTGMASWTQVLELHSSVVNPVTRAEDVAHATDCQATCCWQKANNKALHQLLAKLKTENRIGTNTLADRLQPTPLALIPAKSKSSSLPYAELDREEFIKHKAIFPHFRRLRSTTTSDKE